MMDHLPFSAVEIARAVGSNLGYLDPGMGSYALQILLATLFGGLFALKQSWSVVKTWLDSNLIGGSRRVTSKSSKTGSHAQPTAEIR